MKELENRILAVFTKESLKTFKVKEIARKLGMPKNEYSKLRTLVKKLANEGKILRFNKNRYALKSGASEVTGELLVSSQGYGFVTRENGDDVFVNQKNMGLALHKDIVKVRLFASSRGKSPEGIILEIVERKRKSFVGSFIHGKYYSYVIPDDLKINKDIIISPESQLQANDGDKVVVSIESWEHKQLNPIGKIDKVLGPPDQPGVDVLSIIHHFELPLEFPVKIEKQTDEISHKIPFEEIQRRLDLRELPVFTIDPDDAKDFDDAISLEHMDNGHLRLGVHIADVSYYVQENSFLDQEAADRGTSVYLVDRVVPMLPEVISNDLCSLVEGKDRLCFSVIMEIDNGEMVSYVIRETVINSHKRFTYKQVQDIIDGNTAHELKPVIMEMFDLSRKFIKKRTERGSVDFDSLEVKVELDDKGVPINIVRRVHGDSNRMIEEFMLLANETVAKHAGITLEKSMGTPVPFVYRVHEKPEQSKIDELLRVTKAFGIKLVPPKTITPKFFQKAANELREHPAATVLEDSLLRAMMKARYTMDNLGHFGLAYTHYTHFTSPIRRYPDLMVHRLLKKYTQDPVPRIDKKDLKKKCQVATEREIRAQEAERASVKMKQAEFLERHIGEEFDGVIARMVSFGFFVSIPELLVDGLVHVATMDDYYVFDEKRYSFIGKTTGKVYKLGNKVRVKIYKVDRNERLIDFVLV